MTALKLHRSPTLDIYSALSHTEVTLPFIGEIAAGFPSPAADFLDLGIDLNKLIVKHPAATFYGRAKGYSMKEAGIGDGDLLVIDKSIEPRDGKIGVCFIDGEFTVKRISIINGQCWLMPENKDFQPIEVKPENQLQVWGIVTHVIKAL